MIRKSQFLNQHPWSKQVLRDPVFDSSESESVSHSVESNSLYSTLSHYIRKCHDTFHQLFLLTQLLILFYFKPPNMIVSKDVAIEVKDTAEYWT